MAKQKTKSAAAKKTAAAKKKTTAKNPKEISQNDLHWLIDHVTEMMNDFLRDHDSDSALTGRERQRLIGAGVRNYGAQKCTA